MKKSRSWLSLMAAVFATSVLVGACKMITPAPERRDDPPVGGRKDTDYNPLSQGDAKSLGPLELIAEPYTLGSQQVLFLHAGGSRSGDYFSYEICHRQTRTQCFSGHMLVGVRLLPELAGKVPENPFDEHVVKMLALGPFMSEELVNSPTFHAAYDRFKMESSGKELTTQDIPHSGRPEADALDDAIEKAIAERLEVTKRDDGSAPLLGAMESSVLISLGTITTVIGVLTLHIGNGFTLKLNKLLEG